MYFPPNTHLNSVKSAALNALSTAFQGNGFIYAYLSLFAQRA